jgi:hypothetical protein
LISQILNVRKSDASEKMISMAYNL